MLLTATVASLLLSLNKACVVTFAFNVDLKFKLEQLDIFLQSWWKVTGVTNSQNKCMLV